MTNKKLSEKIVKAVLKNLKDRSGIGDAIEGCDDEIQKEIEDDLTEEVGKILDSETKGA